MQGGHGRNSLGLTLTWVLFLHNRYRTTGGEERVVADLMALVREQPGRGSAAAGS